MNKYSDDYIATFNDRPSFMDELTAHRLTQAVEETTSDACELMMSEELPADSIRAELISDTDTQGSSLYIWNNGKITPLRSFAINGLKTVMGVKGSFLNKLTIREFADMVNTYVLPKSKKKLVLIIEDEKVSGIGGSSFSEIPAVDVFSEVTEYLRKEFPHAEYAGGTFTHEYVDETWSLKAYSSLFESMLDGMKVVPSFNISTSDCGASSVTLRPLLKGDIMIPLTPERVEHRGNNGLEEVREALNKIYSLIEKGCNSVNALKDIEIRYPETTILRVMKACKIPKEAGLNAAAEFEMMRGTKVTALDIFQAVCTTLSSIPAEASSEQRFRCMDDVSRVAGVDWRKYDLPTKFSW